MDKVVKWRPIWEVVDGKAKVVNASVECPQCGAKAVLDHDIAIDGTITPSLVCPFDCGFHANARLHDWSYGAVKREGAGQ